MSDALVGLTETCRPVQRKNITVNECENGWTISYRFGDVRVAYTLEEMIEAVKYFAEKKDKAEE